jgi:anti-anti-sigma regulatory factor
VPEPLLLPAELTIHTVGELRPQWLAWLDDVKADATSTEALVDGAAVDDIDAAGVQLLMALSRSLAEARHPLRFVHPSRALVLSCLALGHLTPESALDGATVELQATAEQLRASEAAPTPAGSASPPVDASSNDPPTG